MWTYPLALAAVSVLVAALERWRPARPDQPALRRGLLTDAVYLVFNAHPLGVLIAAVAARTVDPLLLPHVDLRLAAAWPLAVQTIVAIVAMDFIQWCVHVTLHRVPVLWRLHQVHHSVGDGQMDWIASFRFHWAEAVIYKAAQYVPLALLGFDGRALMAHAVVGTLVGHLNHANLDWGHGPWRYVLNSPRMHLWHHDRAGVEAVNFGIILSAWDWLFGTARMPDGPPVHLGFPGDEAMPPDFVRRSLWPLLPLR